MAAQIRAARAMLSWTQDDLAARSGVAKRSIAGLELAITVAKSETVLRLVEALSAAGIEFTKQETNRYGVLLSEKSFTFD